MTGRLIDYDVATRLLAGGMTVREVADYFKVTTQAVHWAIAQGHIARPQPAVT